MQIKYDSLAQKILGRSAVLLQALAEQATATHDETSLNAPQASPKKFIPRLMSVSCHVSEEIPQPGDFDNLFGGQDGAD
jgi:hypothetical protein